MPESPRSAVLLQTLWPEGKNKRWRRYQIMKTWWAITGSWHILLPCQWHGATVWQRVIDLNYSAQAKVESAENESGGKRQTNCIQKHVWTWGSLCVRIDTTHIEITDEAIGKEGQKQQGSHHKHAFHTYSHPCLFTPGEEHKKALGSFARFNKTHRFRSIKSETQG